MKPRTSPLQEFDRAGSCRMLAVVGSRAIRLRQSEGIDDQ